MCKLMAFSDGARIKNLKLVVNRALPLLTASDRHGFGWSAWSRNGAFGERMTDLGHGYRLDLNQYAVGKLPIADTYNTFGTVGPITGGVLLHARTSTNQKTLLNTHPIQRNDWTLVHNGVVSNRGPKYDMLTTNDTEHLVHYLSTEGIESVEKHLSGYYAFAAFDSEGKLHVCRDSNATLFVAWVRSVQSYVFATTRDLIEELCSEMKWKLGPIDAIADDVYMILQGNEIISTRKIKPRGYDAMEQSKMSQSLHYLNSSERKESLARSSGGANRSIFDGHDVITPTGGVVDASVSPGESDAAYLEYGYSKDAIDYFVLEMKLSGRGLRIFDSDNNQIEPWEFAKLNLLEQVQCCGYREDGTILTVESVEHELDDEDSQYSRLA